MEWIQERKKKKKDKERKGKRKEGMAEREGMPQNLVRSWEQDRYFLWSDLTLKSLQVKEQVSKFKFMFFDENEDEIYFLSSSLLSHSSFIYFLPSSCHLHESVIDRDIDSRSHWDRWNVMWSILLRLFLPPANVSSSPFLFSLKILGHLFLTERGRKRERKGERKKRERGKEKERGRKKGEKLRL